jgi:hypothetical protein
MESLPANIEVYPIHHLPIVKAYADQLGLVYLLNQLGSTEMDVDPGTVVLGLILDTLSGHSPLYRLQDFFAQQDTEHFGPGCCGGFVNLLPSLSTRDIKPLASSLPRPTDPQDRQPTRPRPMSPSPTNITASPAGSSATGSGSTSASP